ncbi:MAG TPA: hypothetical protein VMJ11_02205 [Paraburkholderia sp.]|uniref:hypothetical protein n=1 Tax=Paraburkholderia sp. TaxID=1926495 RepID=UPI002C5ED5E9|nr:hypothetical protein [Paraburkholderia sp.]HTR05483.1 hypothetical protein [Paraburkholderia sp.]
MACTKADRTPGNYAEVLERHNAMLANWRVKAKHFKGILASGFNIWEPEANSRANRKGKGFMPVMGGNSSAENRRHGVARIHGSGTFRVMNEIVGVLLLPIAYSRVNVS